MVQAKPTETKVLHHRPDDAEDKYECFICCELCVQPVVAPCGHFMCFQCHKKCAAAGGTRCPMCRVQWKADFIPKVCQKLQAEIEQAAGKEFQKRKAQLQRASEWVGAVQLMKFTYGNTHKTIKDWKNPRRPDDPPKVMHDWKMYISINGKAVETKKYISSVTYKLHPTYA